MGAAEALGLTRTGAGVIPQERLGEGVTDGEQVAA